MNDERTMDGLCDDAIVSSLRFLTDTKRRKLSGIRTTFRGDSPALVTQEHALPNATWRASRHTVRSVVRSGHANSVAPSTPCRVKRHRRVTQLSRTLDAVWSERFGDVSMGSKPVRHVANFGK